MKRLENKTAIITGAASGIGASLAKAFAAEGAKVVVADIADTKPCTTEIENLGGQAMGIQVDITSHDALCAMVQQVQQQFKTIDVLINNAGLLTGLAMQPFWEISEAEWDQVLKINTRGAFQCVKAVLPCMREQAYGKIINIASGSFFFGPPGMLHYVASKSAIVGMTRAMSRELGPLGIRINSITPGFTVSENLKKNEALYESGYQNAIEQRSIKRAMLPEDLVGAALFLSSKDSDFITGQIINVDGGKNTW